MAKKTNKKQISLLEALNSFDLNKFKCWVKENNKPLWKTFGQQNETVQMATMCKMICNRTDMLGSDVHKQARTWLREHNMRGGIM